MKKILHIVGIMFFAFLGGAAAQSIGGAVVTVGVAAINLITTLNFDGTGVTTKNAGLFISEAVTGSCNGVGSPTSPNGPDCAANEISVNSNNLTGLSNSLNPALKINHIFGGANAVGGFMGVLQSLELTSATGNVSSTGFYVANQDVAVGAANDNGTAGATNGRGALFAHNSSVRLQNTATFWQSITGDEIDVAAAAGTSVNEKHGLSIVQTSIDAVSGTLENSAINISNQVLTSSGWTCGLCFGDYSGVNPMQTSGTLIGTFNQGGSVGGGAMGTVAHGIDISNYIFSSDAFKSPSFNVDGSGVVTAAAYKSGATAGVDCTGITAGTVTVSKGIVTHC